MTAVLSKNKTIGVLFLEGFVSVSLQMIMMRQLVPFFGSSVIVSSLVIGVFLASLALGYAVGGRVKENFVDKLKSNLLISAGILSFCLSYPLLDYIFFISNQLIGNKLIEVSLYLIIFLAPIVFLLGQTVPLLTNFYKSSRASEITGDSLAISTVGSVLGSVITSLIFFSYFGIAKTILIDVMFLGIVLFLIIDKKDYVFSGIVLSLILGVCYLVNVTYEKDNFQKTNEYNNYQIAESDAGDRYFIMNKSYASAVLSNGNSWDYIETLKEAFYTENNLDFKNKDILILGAGGFTMTYPKNKTPDNNYTYVDIDPDIVDMTERFFLKEQINGDFVVEDARLFVNRNKGSYDAIIVDLYSNKTTIPWHLMTDEFIHDLRESVRENGVVAFNIISDGFFMDDYSKTIHNTIRNNFNYCVVKPNNLKGSTNIVYICKKIEGEQKIYVDNFEKQPLESI